MRKTRKSTSIHDDIMKAIETYEYDARCVFRAHDGYNVAQYGSAAPARTHACDLNARAVIDAIVGRLRWEGFYCYLGTQLIGMGTSPEDRAAVVAKFKEVWFEVSEGMVGEGGGGK